MESIAAKLDLPEITAAHPHGVFDGVVCVTGYPRRQDWVVFKRGRIARFCTSELDARLAHAEIA